MRITRLSAIHASRVPCYAVGPRGVYVRTLHSSAQMRNESVPQSSNRPEWFQRIVNNGARPPKLYAWTTKDLSSGRGTVTQALKTKVNSDDTLERRRIYILGVGNIGRLYAMCLSKLANPPPITLVVHRKELLEHWAADPGIELTRDGKSHKSAGFDVEWWTDSPPSASHDVEIAGGRSISNLIVATKSSIALPQIDNLRRYLDSDSTVCFTQNGICKMWPPLGNAYVQARFPAGSSPNWIACVTTHGVISQGPFKSIHASPANALVGPVLRGAADKEENMSSLMQDIANAPELCARQLTSSELWVAQLEKLVINAIINPLTAVLRCKNGEIFTVREDALPAVIDKLVAEASVVLSGLIMDRGSDGILFHEPAGETEITEEFVHKSLHDTREQLVKRFSPSALRSMLDGVGAKVGENKSSMFQDVSAGRETEIDDINGWLVDTAKIIALDGKRSLQTHERLINLVKDRAELSRGELCVKLLGESHC
ncbi:ketoisovalerate reductase [Xylaria nigripes]|nr:ketoisovalerate reductase [Xylaria nigripes]